MTQMSADEEDKMASHQKAMDDRQSGLVKVTEAARPDGGMAETGEMPGVAPTPAPPMNTSPAGPAPGTMPTHAMDATETRPPPPGGEMPRPPMT